MQRHTKISLNAIRVFMIVARHQSIARAANELGVTPSAVSHQIKNLEMMLATPLFVRGNNAIALTSTGRHFLDEVLPGLRVIEQAVDNLVRDANEITVRVSATLAVRWLIPALDGFKEQCPEARIRIETSLLDEDQLGQSVDMAIIYRGFREGEGGSYNEVQGEKLLADFSRPVLAPELLRASGYALRKDIGLVPAITCAADNWDWKLWAGQMDVPIEDIKFADQFDMDDAALHAATAGMGMVLAPSLMTISELKAGSLVVLPDVEPAELGAFYLLTGLRSGGVVKKFRNWLMKELTSLKPDSKLSN